MERRARLAAGLAAWSLFFLACLGPAHAQPASADYPNRPVHIIVPFPPGGSSDVVVRMLVPRLAERLGQPVVVDNRPGAGGNIGLAATAKSPGDGYTLGVGAAGGLTANVSLYPQLPYDPVKDFQPVGMLAEIPFVLAGHPSLQARSLPEVLALARAAPGKLAIGHGGNGTAMHLSAELLAQMAGVRFSEVPYRGSGPAALDLLAGQIPLAVVDLPSSLQQIKAGKLVAYAVSGARRVPMLPDVPTVAEAGVPGYESTGWFGVVAPAGTAAVVVARVNAELVAALSDSAIREPMLGLGVAPAPGSAEEFGRTIKAEIQKWARVIKVSGTHLD